MVVGKVVLPKPLVKACRDGKLVVFAGAGVSMGPPSKLPDFADLAKQVASGTGKSVNGVKNPVQFLGKLHREETDVHRSVRRILTDNASSPAPLHKEILRLFPDPDKVRVVTTNFDTHFSKAAEDVFSDMPEEYLAPALPLGDDFRGIVYLHGSVRQRPHRMVLTDEDFGRAYLTEGWARRFLQALFLEYVVLFVGYSHSDEIVTYLSRGLPPVGNDRRFALRARWKRDEEDATNWDDLGITPIDFPKAKDEDPYAELPRTFRIWHERASQTAIEYAQEIRQLVLEGDPPSPSVVVDVDAGETDEVVDTEERSEYDRHDRLKEAISKPAGRRVFCEHAVDPTWLQWANRAKILKPLLNGEATDTKKWVDLAGWIERSFVKQHFEQCFAIVAPYAGSLDPMLWNAIARGLWDNSSKDDLSPEEVAKWIQMLLVRPPQNASMLARLWSSELRLPEDRDAALLIFRYLTEPRFVVQRGSGQYFEIEHRFDDSSRTGIIRGENNYDAFVESAAEEILEIARSKFWELRSRYRSSGVVFENGNDPTEFKRSTIEPNVFDQRYRTSGLDNIIDITRDALEWMLVNEAKKSETIINRWVVTAVPLLKRLAVHGVSKYKGWDASEKHDWVLTNNLLYEPKAKHEVFRLLRRVYPDLSTNERKEVLESAWEEWPGLLPDSASTQEAKEHEIGAYKVYNLLYWLSESLQSCDLLSDYLSRVEEQYPHFGPREHPDRDFWRSGSHSNQQVRSDGQPSHALELNPVGDFTTISDLLQKGSSQGDVVLTDVTQALEQEFDWGMALAREFVRRGKEDRRVWEHILHSWRECPIDQSQWGDLLTFLLENDQLHQFAELIASFLETRSIPEEGDLPVDVMGSALQLADRLLEEVRHVDSGVGDDASKSIQYLNHPGSTITRFYLYALWGIYEHADVQGLSADWKERFAAILDRHDKAAIAGKRMLGMRLGSLFDIDPHWTRKTFLPRLHWAWEDSEDQSVSANKSADSAEALWGGLGRATNSIQPDLFLDLVALSTSVFPHLSDLSLESRKLFSRLVLRLAISDVIDPFEDDWLMRFIKHADDEVRVYWAQQMTRVLRQLNQSRTQKLWEDWLCDYWKVRVEGKPKRLSESETARMIGWIVELGSRAEEGVHLLTQTKAPKDGFSDVLFLLWDNDFLSTQPQAATKLLIHLLGGGVDIKKGHFSQVEDILEKISESDGCQEDDFKTLVERVVDLGCIDTDTATSLIESCMDKA